MVNIAPEYPVGIHWDSSLKGSWFMDTDNAKLLLNGWDRKASIIWVWDAKFADGSESIAYVRVPPGIGEEIENYIDRF